MTLPPVLFADASFYTALFNRRDVHHARAAAWQIEIVASVLTIVTTEAVLWEFLNSCSTPSTRAAAFEGYKRLHNDRSIEVVGFDSVLIERALRMYETCSDKAWGIIDCLSFAVMKQHGLTHALTADHHFQQAGFVPELLQDPPQ